MIYLILAGVAVVVYLFALSITIAINQRVGRSKCVTGEPLQPMGCAKVSRSAFLYPAIVLFAYCVVMKASMLTGVLSGVGLWIFYVIVNRSSWKRF